MPQPPDLICLPNLTHDTQAQLADIRGGRHLTRRLLALGLRQGSLLSVVQHRGQGLVLASGEVRIAVGLVIAEKLWVRLVPTEDKSRLDATGPESASESGGLPGSEPREHAATAVATP